MHQMFTIHTALEEFENGGLTLEMHKMFSLIPHYVEEFFKRTQHLPVILPLCLR